MGLRLRSRSVEPGMNFIGNLLDRFLFQFGEEWQGQVALVKGVRVGQVIGATDRTAGAATRRPVTYKEVFATLYRNLGIDATRTTIVDPSGRPQYLLADHQPIAELV